MDNGKVYSGKREIYLKPDISEKGYTRVTLCKNGKTKKFLVHRLVAEHYISNPKLLPDINHIDNNPANNHHSNLEWCTHSENMIHCHKQGRCSNLIASEKAKQVMFTNMTKKYSGLLKDKFIDYNTADKRGFVKYYCTRCNSITKVRTDSSLLKEDAMCNSCSRKKKI